MASHGDAETAAADIVFEPRVKFAGNSYWDFFLFLQNSYAQTTKDPTTSLESLDRQY